MYMQNMEHHGFLFESVTLYSAFDNTTFFLYYNGMSYVVSKQKFFLKDGEIVLDGNNEVLLTVRPSKSEEIEVFEYANGKTVEVTVKTAKDLDEAVRTEMLRFAYGTHNNCDLT